MKDLFINYSIRAGNNRICTYVQNSFDKTGYSLVRIKTIGSKTGYDKTTHYKIKHFKTLAAAVRASRRWVHDVMGDEYAKTL